MQIWKELKTEMLQGITYVTALLQQNSSKGIDLQRKQAFRLCAKIHTDPELVEATDLCSDTTVDSLCHLTPPDLISGRSLKV